MTTVLEAPQLWSTMPGWGIVADLTPPELIESRRLKALRKLIVAGLVAVLVLCAGGYELARLQRSSAQGALDRTSERTTQLQAQVSRYSGVTRIQGTVAQVQSTIG